MQKFGPKSQNLSVISGFQNFVKLRFRITLTSKNCYNSLDFEDTGPKFCMQGGGVKKSKKKFLQNFCFLYRRNVNNFQINI